MMMMLMRLNDHFGTLMLIIACSGSLSGVEGGGGCLEPSVCPSGDGRCKTADGGHLMVTISGRIASMESSCLAPLANEEIRLYTGCAQSKDFNVEPAAGWKTGKDGTFEVSVPFKSGTGLLRTELCLTPRRRCQPLTLSIPAQRKNLAGARYAVSGATSISAADGQQSVVVGEAKNGDKAVRVNLCLGEKRRRRRLAGWDDRDMSWLRKKSTEKKRQDPAAGKRGWSNGIPWLKRPHPSPPASFRRAASTEEHEKRLWEGADDEVGWIKRHSTGDDDEERPEKEDLPPNDEDDMTAADYTDDDNVPSDGQPGKRRSKEAGTQFGLAAVGRGSRRPEETKKYWAQSDMSWL